jgi:hypothetical protein
VAIDHDGLHVLLWMRAHKVRHTVRINQSELARELQTSRFTMSRVMAAMIAEERVKPIGQSYHNSLYRITDPDEWSGQDDGDVRAPDHPDAVGT